jgi:hypothetical protein
VQIGALDHITSKVAFLCGLQSAFFQIMRAINNAHNKLLFRFPNRYHFTIISYISLLFQIRLNFYHIDKNKK